MSDVLVGYVLAAVSAVFVAALLPACLDRNTRISASTSGMTTICLEISAACYFYLGLYWTAASTSVLAAAWAFLLFRRRGRSPKPFGRRKEGDADGRA